MARLAQRGPAQRRALVDALECELRWIPEDRHHPKSLRAKVAAPPIVKLMKHTLKALEKLCKRADADEARELPARFATISVTALAGELRMRGTGYVVDHPAQGDFSRAILRHLDALPFEALEAMAMQCIRTDEHTAMAATLAFMFLKDKRRADAFVNPPPHPLARGTLNTGLMYLTPDWVGSDWDAKPWRKAVHDSPQTMKALAASKKRLARAFLSPFDRVEL
jgi:hypothetical protein